MATEKMMPMVSMYKLLSTSQNPMEMLQKAAENNDNFKTVLQQMKSYSNPQQAFYEQARSSGLTDEQIENGLAQIEQLLGTKRP